MVYFRNTSKAVGLLMLLSAAKAFPTQNLNSDGTPKHVTTKDQSLEARADKPVSQCADGRPPYSGQDYGTNRRVLFCKDTDFSGGDESKIARVNNEIDCFAHCGILDPCVAASYHRDSMTCYLKNVKHKALHSPGVDSAYVTGDNDSGLSTPNRLSFNGKDTVRIFAIPRKTFKKGKTAAKDEIVEQDKTAAKEKASVKVKTAEKGKTESNEKSKTNGTLFNRDVAVNAQVKPVGTYEEAMAIKNEMQIKQDRLQAVRLAEHHQAFLKKDQYRKDSGQHEQDRIARQFRESRPIRVRGRTHYANWKENAHGDDEIRRLHRQYNEPRSERAEGQAINENRKRDNYGNENELSTRDAHRPSRTNTMTHVTREEKGVPLSQKEMEKKAKKEKMYKGLRIALAILSPISSPITSMMPTIAVTGKRKQEEKEKQRKALQADLENSIEEERRKPISARAVIPAIPVTGGLVFAYPSSPSGYSFQALPTTSIASPSALPTTFQTSVGMTVRSSASVSYQASLPTGVVVSVPTSLPSVSSISQASLPTGTIISVPTSLPSISSVSQPSPALAIPTSLTTPATMCPLPRLVGRRVCTSTCNQDRPGSDYFAIFTSSFDACIQKCGDDAACVTAQWLHTNGYCYLKDKKNDAVGNASVDTVDCV